MPTLPPFATSIRRRAFAGITVAATALVLLPATPAAAADDCTASGLARTISGVAASTADYLDAHPDVNDAFTKLKGESRPQMRADAQRYLDANPSVRADLQHLRAPLNDFAQRCGVALPPGPLGG
ncbi:heme-binding protein [Mycobacterium sp. CVI_P3]|uniref:Heme-binding protein n=1 Tax=Mycobacterium pinniadriaticum TaxID=2994102 RepID=A0ABT3S6Z7_9MYCO|nr:heme-binding protein [Mycobacterium pinniadriaticum]MCX2928860.1 heme-binding protein [Mycobacterium pinniadriaticum]MCX2935273.1 heme-binding protein [Mycobacterium pinniadriaticum]